MHTIRFERYYNVKAQKRPQQLRPSTRRWNRETLLAVLRQDILNIQTNPTPETRRLHIEKMAEKYRAKRNIVAWCFSRLKTEGLIGKPVNGIPSESPFSRKRSEVAWTATAFYVTGT